MVSFSHWKKFSHLLSTRIIVGSLLAWLCIVSMALGTLLLSWQLEGASAAINEAGKLRMQAQQITTLLNDKPIDQAQLQQVIQKQNNILYSLLHNESNRTLVVPSAKSIQQQLQLVNSYWKSQVLPTLAIPTTNHPSSLNTFIHYADQLVSDIEKNNEYKNDLLRFSQIAIVLICLSGGFIIVFLLFKSIIYPLKLLNQALQKINHKQFDTRLVASSNNEFGLLSKNFNQMATDLERLYLHLEDEVNNKTKVLLARNTELSNLYELSSFLHKTSDLNQISKGFLDIVMRQTGADAASLRTYEENNQHISLVASSGLPTEIVESEFCIHINDCHCGIALQSDNPNKVLFTPHNSQKKTNLCSQHGYSNIVVFPIRTINRTIGLFSLHFKQPVQLDENQNNYLDTLGTHLGVAFENHRLQAFSEQLAVILERQLLAQDLHDNIAQNLNYLNLQLQIIDEIIAVKDMDALEEHVQTLHLGINECYGNVRELLTNFRSSLTDKNFDDALKNTIQRFKRQTGMTVSFEYNQQSGAPLPPDHQLQTLFILQETLSNIRKHAKANYIDITITNSRDFEMIIRDDGVGFDITDLTTEDQFGRLIMQERAQRMNAVLNIDSSPNAGTVVSLTLPQNQRKTA